jgi:hypothetical protein
MKKRSKFSYDVTRLASQERHRLYYLLVRGPIVFPLVYSPAHHPRNCRDGFFHRADEEEDSAVEANEDQAQWTSAFAINASACGPRERTSHAKGLARLRRPLVTSTSGTISWPCASFARTKSTVASSVAIIVNRLASARCRPGQIRRPKPKHATRGSRTFGSSLPSGVRYRSGLKVSGSG